MGVVADRKITKVPPFHSVSLIFLRLPVWLWMPRCLRRRVVVFGADAFRIRMWVSCKFRFRPSRCLLLLPLLPLRLPPRRDPPPAPKNNFPPRPPSPSRRSPRANPPGPPPLAEPVSSRRLLRCDGRCGRRIRGGTWRVGRRWRDSTMGCRRWEGRGRHRRRRCGSFGGIGRMRFGGFVGFPCGGSGGNFGLVVFGGRRWMMMEPSWSRSVVGCGRCS
mmetsp:Transcript_7141/g.13481  ORF Transcript_7141/g.13481 Transcript_7141/m.13481 type:complete len:218 (+) Transcript_7141:231-884(+)